MRLASFLAEGSIRTGVMDGAVVHEVSCALRELLMLVTAGSPDALAQVRSGATYQLSDVQLLSPVSSGARIFCVGINYLEHQRESADAFVSEIPKRPIIFSKTLEAIAHPGEVLRLAESVSRQFDWEVELAAVVGCPARDLTPTDAPSIVAGYSVLNDVTARDLQREHVQWFLGKNSDRSTPLGPWIVTRTELGSEPDLAIELRVNGTLKQAARTSELIFGIPELLATISRVTTLQPGDVIATGTPSGVGFKRQPPEFLTDGDVVEASIEGIGVLRNSITTLPSSQSWSANDLPEVFV